MEWGQLAVAVGGVVAVAGVALGVPILIPGSWAVMRDADEALVARRARLGRRRVPLGLAYALGGIVLGITLIWLGTPA